MPVTESPLNRLLLKSPFWLLGIIILGAMIAAALIGWRARLWQNSARASSPEDDVGERQEGHIVAAVIGLLALLTGFTFALALERYDTRRERVLSEANAIGTTSRSSCSVYPGYDLTRQTSAQLALLSNLHDESAQPSVPQRKRAAVSFLPERESERFDLRV